MAHDDGLTEEEERACATAKEFAFRLVGLADRMVAPGQTVPLTVEQIAELAFVFGIGYGRNGVTPTPEEIQAMAYAMPVIRAPLKVIKGGKQ